MKNISQLLLCKPIIFKALMFPCHSNLQNEIKRNLFHAAVVSVLLYGGTTRTLTKRIGEKAGQELH